MSQTQAEAPLQSPEKAARRTVKRVLWDNVLVRPIKLGERVSGGGIIAPDTHRAATQVGIVVMVGPDVAGFEPGMQVMYSMYSGNQVGLNLDDEDILMGCREISAEVQIEEVTIGQG